VTTYLVLLRGVNVGGKNPVSMARLREALEGMGFANVSTYIASGNVILDSDKAAGAIQAAIEDALPRIFKLDDELVRVLVLSRDHLQAVIDRKPQGFGEQPDTYHSDVLFLMGIGVDDVMPLFDPREGVDRIWPGDGVVYSQRLSALRTRSRLNKVIATPAYKAMTIRSWSTTARLAELLRR
jgi:uncharacterized protein (DUF1697 family)